MLVKQPPQNTLCGLLLFLFGLAACNTVMPTEPSEAKPVPAPGIYQTNIPEDPDHRITVSIPTGYTGTDPVPFVLALHYGGRVTPYYGRGVLEGLVGPGLHDLGAIIIAPDSRHGDWTSEQSAEDIQAVIDFALTEYNINQARTVITGYSMGGMGTWYIGARQQEFFKAAVPIAGAPQSDSDTFDWELPVYAIHSQADELIPSQPTEDFIQLQQSKGADMQLVLVQAVTHYETNRLIPYLQQAIPWIQTQWDK